MIATMYWEAGVRHLTYLTQNDRIRYSPASSRHSSSHCPKFKKLGEPKNMAKYTQVYAGELVSSDNGGDWSSYNCQMLCEIVKHVIHLSSKLVTKYHT